MDRYLNNFEDFIFKRIAIWIVNDIEIGMADPGSLCSLVQFNSRLDTLSASSIIC